MRRNRRQPCPECGVTGNHRRDCTRYCREAGKIRFPTLHDAQVALTEAAIGRHLHRETFRQQSRAYWHQACEAYHLTKRSTTERTP